MSFSCWLLNLNSKFNSSLFFFFFPSSYLNSVTDIVFFKFRSFSLWWKSFDSTVDDWICKNFKVSSVDARKLFSIRCSIEALILHHFSVNIFMHHNNSFSFGNNFVFPFRLLSSVLDFLSSHKTIPRLFNFCTRCTLYVV